MALMPGFEIVSIVIGFANDGIAIMLPEKISWKIRTKGMIVMAAVVFLTKVEIQRDRASEA